jgi:hypothetical protein
MMGIAEKVVALDSEIRFPVIVAEAPLRHRAEITYPNISYRFSPAFRGSSEEE